MDAPVGEKGNTENSEGDMDTPTSNPEIVQLSEKQEQVSTNKPTAHSTPPQPSQLTPAEETIDTADTVNDSIHGVSAAPAAPSASSAPSDTIAEDTFRDSPLMGGRCL